MGLAGDGAGCSVADTVTGAGPGKLKPTENQQELQPTAPFEHFVGLGVFRLLSSENHLFLYSRLKLVRFSFEVDPELSWIVV